MSDTQTDKTKELKAKVEEAIAAVTDGGQSYKIGSRQLTRANLTELKNLRAELAAEEEMNKNSPLISRTFVAVFEGR